MSLTTTEDIEDIYELSPMQQGMLFHTLYAPGSGVYFEQSSMPIRGVNVPAFERAWQEVINRHPVLRTSFYWEDLEKPLQVVHRNAELPLDQQDWRGVSASDREWLLSSYLQANRSRGFDLAESPLLRLSLLRLSEDTYQFVLNFHHILLDGWSKDLIMKEVFTCYEAFCWGRDCQLASPRPYGEYIAWLQQQDLTEAEAYWRNVLKGFNEPTRLGAGRAKVSDVVKEEFGEVETRLPKSITTSLLNLAREQQLTLNAIVQGAWGLLLSRYTAQEDILFGTIVSGRPPQLQGVESMVGLFINALPVRLRVSPESTVTAYLKQLQKQQAQMRQYEYSPLLRVQGWSELSKGVPLFDSLLVFENYPGSSAPAQTETPAEVSISYFERTNYPLTIMIAPGAEIWLKILYSKRQFDDPAIDRMLSHYARILEQFIEPHRRLSDLELLDETERKLIQSFSVTSASSSASSACVHHLFEAQAARSPQAIALIDDSEQLTYMELDKRANHLAEHLRDLGISTEAAVGLCLPRSAKLLISLLGILKAGGAYVPLDPAYPNERLRWMIENSELKLIITGDGALSSDLGPGIRQLDLNQICEQGHSQVERKESDITGDNLAYVLYTSGSTGRPKGVAMPHGALLSLIRWHCDELTTARNARVLQFAPLSFDVSFQEIFSTWYSGGTVILISEQERGDPFEMSRLLKDQSIERLFLPFVALQQLAERLTNSM